MRSPRSSQFIFYFDQTFEVFVLSRSCGMTAVSENRWCIGCVHSFNWLNIPNVSIKALTTYIRAVREEHHVFFYRKATVSLPQGDPKLLYFSQHCEHSFCFTSMPPLCRIVQLMDWDVSILQWHWQLVSCANFLKCFLLD